MEDDGVFPGLVQCPICKDWYSEWGKDGIVPHFEDAHPDSVQAQVIALNRHLP